MPTLENFELSNYGLGGPGGSNYKSSPMTNLNTTFSVPGSTSSPVLGYNTLLKFEAGTKLITLAPITNAARLVLSPSTNVTPYWALMDSNNVIWFLSLGTPSQTYSYNSIIVDLEAGLATSGYMSNNYGFTSSQAQWNFYQITKPATFNINSEMRLVVVASNSNTSNSTFVAIVTDVKVISA